MARGVNKVILVGNLGQDPDIRYTGNQSAVANLSIATTESWTDRQTGQKNERTEWHRVVMFGRLAEIAGEYLKKGSQVYLEGKLQTRKWQDQNEQDRYTTEIVANEMQMLGGRNNQPQAWGGTPQSGQYDARQEGGGSNRAAPSQDAYHQSAPQQASGFDAGFGDEAF